MDVIPTGTARVPVSERRRWPSWAGYAAAVWSLVYGLLGLYWGLGGAGFPFGRANDPKADLSVFVAARAEIGGPVIAALGLVGAVLAVVMARGRGQNGVRVVAMAFSWVMALVLLILVSDYRVLMAVAYTPLFLVGLPFGWPPVSYSAAVPWPVLNQIVCVVGGFLWAATALAYGRRTRGACGDCGRGEDTGAADLAKVRRRTNWAVAVSVALPVFYALTRYAWLLGIPLGIDEDILRAGQASGLWWAGAGLATIAVGGAVLTVGLVRPWGEVFPRWIPGLRGRRVPVAAAVVPAIVVAVIVTSAGLMYVRLAIAGTLPGGGWATTAPELVWPIWGVALTVAALGYRARRRGRCRHCGRG
ncbi:hypothetical protein [Streptoalloteichus hindustanus]|uniref:Uncharacterized protein n=1 Tax=Streptoalloteichus hindustanus TaxID=2017 RepID=A0A1M4XUI9_STRHI|nr:hypothetical protein [Streptoalloteichus hindustanus]SHE97247.1 hypothetical protein SAMN05444320_102132 [Streptoalloteichus hindustanus]